MQVDIVVADLEDDADQVGERDVIPFGREQVDRDQPPPHFYQDGASLTEVEIREMQPSSA